MAMGMPRSVVMGMLGAALAGSAAENVLRDPGFEEGGTGWSLDALHVLVTNSAAAASGRVCLRGETTAPRQAARLIQTVEVRSNRVYRFRVRARGTPGVFMALFATFPRRTARERIAAWDSISPQWRTFETPPFTPSADGRLVLELISPSSFAGKPGRLWVDDVELIEEVPPRGVELSAAQGFNDEPALTRGADGALYAAWISFRDGRDTLQGARIEVAAGDDARVTHRWTVDDGGGDVALLGPRLVAAGDGAVLVYAREQRDEWDIAVVKLSARGPEFRQLLEDGGTDVDPAVASHRDLVWVAWEGSRDGRRRIGVRAVVGGRAGPIEWLSDPSVNACDPAIAVTAAGEVVVAWHDFRNGRVDIWARSRGARTGGWSLARRLTTAPAIDRHPLLLARGDEVWMLYETAQVSEYRVGATIGRRLRLVRITPQGVEEPAAGDGPLAEGSEGPAAAFDESGRLWVAWLAAVAGPKPRDWNVKLAAFAGDRWSAARGVSSLKGMDRRPGLAVVGGTVWVLHQYDNMPANWPNEAAADLARSDVRLAGVPADAPPAAPPTWQCATESAEAFPPADLREARGEETPGWWVEHRGHRWRLFFGDLHEHSDVSPCGRTRDQSVDESYQHMRDLAVHDFACVTDHGYAINSYLWRYLAKLARANEDRGRFLTFLGQEWTSSFEEYSANHPYGFYGHRNLILGDPRFPRWWNEKNRQTPAQLWEDLRRMNADFVTIPHQLADTGNVPTDWSFVDETAQPVAEIFQTRGSYEHEGAPRQARATTPRGWFLQDAWARGIVIGVIASPDHGGGYGKACVYATELSRAAILEALRARRCYGTTGAKILLDVRVGGCFMGEASRSRPPPTVPVEVRVLAPAEIARVDVCRNNVFIYSREVGARQSEFTYVDREVPAGPVWYYVRVQQTDGELAWTSPVWWGAR